MLASYGRFAKRNKVRPRAKEAYDLVLTHYDDNNTVALRALGYKKKKGEWVSLFMTGVPASSARAGALAG